MCEPVINVLQLARMAIEELPGVCTCRTDGYLCRACLTMQTLDALALELSSPPS